MSYYKFHEDDLFINTIRSEPQYSFYIYSGSVYLDNTPNLKDAVNVRDATAGHTVYGVPFGYMSLLEMNVDRPSGPGQRIYPFVYKDGKRNSFKTITQKDYDTQYLPGDEITSSYNMSSSISVIFRDNTANDQDFANRKRMIALKNTLNHYSYLSPHYLYSNDGASGLGAWDKSTQELSLVSIPSIFYGSKIKKGTIKLDYYFSGSLIARLIDSGSNGELVQVSGAIASNDGKVAGVVLYNEGFIILTGSWELNTSVTIAHKYKDAGGTTITRNTKPMWNVWGLGTDIAASSHTSNMLSSSFLLEYSGSTETQVLTMLAHANYGELNYSNNPTAVSASSVNKLSIISAHTGAHQYIEKPLKIKNVVSASYTDQEPPFQKTTYISKVALYDKDKNLIGVAKLAQPVRKTEDLDFTFKIKLDI